MADGLTKPLLGQAFAAFLTNLGMPRQHENEEGEETHSQSAAVMAMIAGGLLLSGVDAEEEITGDTTSEVIWTCGAVLMALGAIYAGQLAFNGVRCCSDDCVSCHAVEMRIGALIFKTKQRRLVGLL